VADAAVSQIVSSGEKEAERLEDVTFEIVNLSGDLLGRAVDNTIQLDFDAAGYGWFVDTTPGDNAEFTQRTGVSELTAVPGSSPFDRVDLLTVVLHELGHVLGHGHEDEGFLDDTLPLGTRRLPLDGFEGPLPADGLATRTVDHAFASYGS
jgi:hypothetical protein